MGGKKVYITSYWLHRTHLLHFLVVIFHFYDHKLLRIFRGPKVRRGGPWRDRQTNTLFVSGRRPITLSKVPQVGSYLIISF